MVHGKDAEMMVSVIMITYGHEKYIEEAINGVFIQQTDFPVELIIANDCSPDQTDEVVNSLISTAPDNITVKYTGHRTNKGMNENFMWAASKATGKYIALCEGDDYWTDPLKLQKQVDFLEVHPDVAVTYHNVGRFDHNTEKLNQVAYFKEDLYLTEREIIKAGGKITPTLSAVFRSQYLKNNPAWVLSSPVGDLPLTFYLMTRGKVYWFKELMGVYRENLPGSWTVKKKNNSAWKNFIFKVKFTAFLQKFNAYTQNKFRSELNTVYYNGSAVKYVLLSFAAYLYRKVR